MMYGSTISRENGYDVDSYTYYPVAIIGAGESGIAMGCRLKEVLGFDQFRVFDRQSGIGGTWWINRYPGIACDIPAVFYSFSFSPNPNWTSFHPSGPEIVKYLQGVCQKYGIVDKIQLNTEVKECRWIESEEVWELTLLHLTAGLGDLSAYDRAQKVRDQGPQAVYTCEEKVRAKVVVSAVGGLVEPGLWPKNIPGIDKFEGQMFHSARWRYDVDLRDKDVIVVGTGCSAAQFVPKLATEYGAKSVTQLMRSPPWVLPRKEPPMGEENWAKWSPWLSNNIPGFGLAIRYSVSLALEYDWRLFSIGKWHEKERKSLEKSLLKYMQNTAPQKYHEILTPNYSVACKRRIVDSGWLASLNDRRIELTTLPLTSVNSKSVTLGPRRLHPDPKDTKSHVPDEEIITLPADVIILANGFQVIKWFHPLTVVGREGKKLDEVFEERGGPQMFMGAAMDSFPNFFALFGPNTATGHSSVILASENVTNLALKFIGPILEGDVAQVEIKKEAEMEWAKDIQRACKQTVWHQGGCTSWYKSESDWNSTVYPYAQMWFTLYCMFPKSRDWNIKYTLKGLVKKRVRLGIRYMLYALALVGVYQATRQGYSVRDLSVLAREYLKLPLLFGANFLQKIAGRL